MTLGHTKEAFNWEKYRYDFLYDMYLIGAAVVINEEEGEGCGV